MFIYLPVNMDIFAEQVGIALIVNSPETIHSAIYYYIVQYAFMVAGIDGHIHSITVNNSFCHTSSIDLNACI